MREGIAEKGDRLHQEGFNCAESVLLIVTGERGIRNSLIPRIATAFGGGIGRQGHICGALSGGVMSIGALYGRDRGEDQTARDTSYTLSSELCTRFRKEFGSMDCYESDNIQA